MLLNKLDRVKAGEQSFCTLLKHDTVHPKYPCSIPTIVTAVEDEEYYGTGEREPGDIFPADAPK